MEEIYPSKFRSLGAEATQSSDYRCLDKLLRHVRISSSDVLTDIGCGEGRVLTYLYLRKFPGRLVGVELDPQVAQRAKERTAHCPNIEIRCANVLEDPCLVKETTIYYLFNPFNGKIFSKFVTRLERECTRPIQLVYLFDYYGAYLDDRPGWHQVWSGDIPRRGGEPAHGLHLHAHCKRVKKQGPSSHMRMGLCRSKNYHSNASATFSSSSRMARC
jgi:SAM-dependent methyltransferase